MYGPKSRGIFRPAMDFMSFSLLVLGICSFLFHASLRHSLQFADELSMLGLAWAMLQGLMTSRPSSSTDRLLSVGLTVSITLFGAFYVYTGKIIYHVIGFIILVILILMRCHYLFSMRKPGFPEEKSKVWRRRTRLALGYLLLGYLL